jgi:maleate cis-trans isomerase
MYGHRARIGYTSPLYLTETFPYEFYQIVPRGVTLALTTLAVVKFTDREVEKSVEMSLKAAGEMARAGVNLIVLGGVPLNLSRGYDGLQTMMQETEKDTGVPVTSSLTAQMNALHALGARKVAVGHPFEQSHGRYGEYLAHYGFEMAVTLHWILRACSAVATLTRTLCISQPPTGA